MPTGSKVYKVIVTYDRKNPTTHRPEFDVIKADHVKATSSDEAIKTYLETFKKQIQNCLGIRKVNCHELK